MTDLALSCSLDGKMHQRQLRLWTRDRRKRFLDGLAATCNVRLASEAAGLPSLSKSAYALRKRDPEFAALWRDALARGYDTLELAVLRGALQAVNAIEIEGAESDDPAVQAAVRRSVPLDGPADRPANIAALKFALSLLTKQATNAEARGRTTRGERYPTVAETDAMIIRLLDRVRERGPAQPSAPNAPSAPSAPSGPSAPNAPPGPHPVAALALPAPGAGEPA